MSRNWVPCIIRGVPYANLKEGLSQEGLEYTPHQRRNIRHNLNNGRGAQIADGPTILPMVEISLYD